MAANTWIQFKNNVLARMQDIVPNDDLFAMCCGSYVKAQLAREVDHDILMAKSYQDQYKDMRRRLLGYQSGLVAGSTLDAAVRVYMPVDNDRQGVQTLITQLIKNSALDVAGLNTFIDRAVREASVDIQTLVPCYRVTSTTSYANTDVVVVGGLTRGQMPQGMQIYEAFYLEQVPALAEETPYDVGQFVESNGRTYMVLSGGLLVTGTLGAGLTSTDGSVEALGGCTFKFVYNEPCIRNYVKQIDWHDRYQLNSLPTGCSTRRTPSMLAIDPDTHTFYAWPQLDDTHTYQITWTSPTLLSFQNTDLVPFDDEVESAVAQYVWTQYYMSVDQDRLQAQIHATAYTNLKSKLFAECNIKRRVMYTK